MSTPFRFTFGSNAPKLTFKQCLGEHGRRIKKQTQNMVDKRVFIDEGACLSFCLQFMCGHYNADIDLLFDKKTYLETAQWLYEVSGAARSERVMEYAQTYGFMVSGQVKGSLLTDEVYLWTFLQKWEPGTYCLVGVQNTARTTGHAFLVFYATNWMLYDPNYGLIEWPSGFNSLAVSFKKILKNKYSDLGPYFPFSVTRFVAGKK